MASEQVLKLLDTFWFETSIFINNNKTTTLDNSNSTLIPQSHVDDLLSLDTKLLRIPTLQVRSFSEENLRSSKIDTFSDFASPNSVLTPQKKKKLQPILSGKEVEDCDHESDEKRVMMSDNHCHRTRLRNKGRKSTRSFSELEFKELKGFMDLGFVFCEEDKESRLVSLIPGLHMLGREEEKGVKVKVKVKEEEEEEEEEEENNNIDVSMICRPYLSEAWGVLDNKKKVVNPLLNWRVPTLGNEIHMKDNLKFWAHTVAASIVR